MSLFRQEVLDARRQGMHNGVVILNAPALVSTLILLIVGITFVIAIFIIFGESSQRTTVFGSIEPEHGLVKVYPQQAGIITKRFVNDGDLVRRGMPLFELTVERSTQAGDVAALSLMGKRARLESLQAHLASIDQQSIESTAAFTQKISGLVTQATQSLEEIKIQQDRVSSAITSLKRFQELADANFIPLLQLQQKKDELLDQQGKLSALKRGRQQILSEIEDLRVSAQLSPLRYKDQRDETEREVLALREEAVESESHHIYMITAPFDGAIAGIQFNEGQTVDIGSIVATIIPGGSALVAKFYVPSEALGMVRVGQEVKLRYKSFPYQKFGQHAGVVTTISRIALRNETAGAKNGAAQYLITVRPKTNFVFVYGRKEWLLPDMEVDADIITGRRRIIEWMFEPLLSIRGKLF